MEPAFHNNFEMYQYDNIYMNEASMEISQTYCDGYILLYFFFRQYTLNN